MASLTKSDERNGARSRPRPSGLTLAEVLVVLGVLVLLVVLLLPAQRGARPAARASQCKNNLKQILLALHNYHDEYGAFPPAHTVDADGRPLHSWRTLILPWVDQPFLYETIDLTKPWDDPANAAARSKLPNDYRCPSHDVPQHKTKYLALVAPGSCLQPGASRRISEITDGLEKTLVIVEVGESQAVHWMSPVDADDALFQALGAKSHLAHTRGIVVGYADGRVDFLDMATPAAKRRSLTTASASD